MSYASWAMRSSSTEAWMKPARVTTRWEGRLSRSTVAMTVSTSSRARAHAVRVRSASVA